jgi:predicted nucleic-acid-binding Zn-ribbon protein
MTMPKVNANFFRCPKCGNIVFEEKHFVVFNNGETESKPGVPYRNNIKYVCTNCGHSFDKYGEAYNG